MNLKNIISKMWNDPVGSKIIANAFWVLPTSLATIIPVVRNGFASLLTSIPVYIVLILIVIFSILYTRLRLRIRGDGKLILDYEHKIANLSAEINSLKLKPTSERYNLFKIGDIVKNRLENNMSSPDSFTVVEKTSNEIICVDKKNNRIVFSPEALSTTDEFQKQKDDYNMTLAAFWTARRMRR